MPDPTPPWEASAPTPPWEKQEGSESSRSDSPKFNESDYTLLGGVKNLAKGTGEQMWEGAKDLGKLVTFQGGNYKPAPGTDPEEAYQKGFADSPGGLAMGASRLFPPIALGSEIFNKAVSPAVDYAAEKAGVDPKHVHTAETLLPALGVKLPKHEVISTKTNPVLHPIESAQKIYKATKDNIVKPVVQKAVEKTLDSDLPIVGGGVKKALESPTAKEGERLGKKMGVNFSTGELTGNSAARTVEDALANSGRWSSKFTESNEQKTNAIVNKFKETLNTINPKSATREGFGQKISSAYESTLTSLRNARRAQAAADAEKAGLATGGKPVLPVNNYVKILQKYVEDGKSPTATAEQRAAGAEAQSTLKGLTEKPKPKSTILGPDGNPIQQPQLVGQFKKITVRDLQNGLAGHGDSAKSSGGMSGAIKTASERRFHNEAKEALEADLDAAAESGQGEGAAALKNFRDNYRRFSAAIGDVQQTALGKIVGKAERDSKGNLVLNHEQLADRFLNMEPSQIKNALTFLDKTHPDVAQMARRYTLEAAYKKASAGSGQSGAGMAKPFSKAEFLKALPDDEHLTALLGDKQAAADVRDIAAALNRVTRWGATRKGSDTAIRLSLRDWGAQAMAKAMVGDQLAEQLLNPKLRKEMVAEAKGINGVKETTGTDALGGTDDPLGAKP